MNKNKALSIFGLSTMLVNLGYSSLVLAQDTPTVSGSQDITCGTHTAGFSSPGGSASYMYGTTLVSWNYSMPQDFSFPDKYITPTNPVSVPTVDADTAVKNFIVNDNEVIGCPTVAVALQVQANDVFMSGTVPLQSTANSAYAVLSVGYENPYLASAPWPIGYTPPNTVLYGIAPVANDGAFSHTGHPNATVAAHNAFANQLDATLDAAADTGAILISPTGTHSAIQVFSEPSGFTSTGNGGGANIDNVNYYIAVPRAVQSGIYTTTVTWSIILT
jgi:hypothetical protein